jgi:hypothetical protein
MHLVYEKSKSNYERLREIKEGSWNTEKEIMGLSSINQKL